MDCKGFEEKLNLYVEGQLGEADAAEVQAHIRDCAACREDYRRLKALVEGLHDLPELELPIDFHARLHEKLKEPPRALPFYRRGWFKIAAGAAAGIVLLAGMASVIGQGGGYSVKSADMAYAATTAAGGYYDEEAVWDGGEYSAEAEEELYEPAASENGAFSLKSAATGNNTAAVASDKLIYTAELSLNSYDFSADWDALTRHIADLGGYVESSSISGTAYTLDGGTGRVGWMTARIPQSEYDGMTVFARSVGEETYYSSYVENVSSQYTEVETRIASLKAQIARLQELIAKAETMEDLITLESKLSDVTYELELYQGQRKDLDSRISYSTLTIHVTEMRTASTTRTPTVRTFGQKVADAFSQGWVSFVDGIQDFFLNLVYNLFDLVVFLVIAAVIVLVICLVVRRIRRKK